MHTATLLAIIGLCSLASTQRLTKPTLESDLNYLKPGVTKLPKVHSTHEEWDGHIPTDCAQMAQDNKLDSNDVSTYTVNYDDCGEPWYLCRHKDSESSIDNLVEMFGKVPVHMRQWVRHMILLPDKQGWAYNQAGNIAMFDSVEKMAQSVFIHETGHSLDLLGAYSEHPLSSSQLWLDQYNLDSNVPDGYAQTNQVENVAQNTVVATFDENVKGGFCSVEKNCKGNEHQRDTLKSEADKAAPGNILQPGGQCTHRLENSNPVPQTKNKGVSRIMRRAGNGEAPDVSLSGNVQVISPVDFNTREHCNHSK